MERPSKFPKFDTSTGSASDLLSRVSSFLPQLKEANERVDAAVANPNLEDSVKLDAQLVLDNDNEEEDSQQANKNEDTEGETEKGAGDKDSSKPTPAPTIELKIALGKVDENPAIEWLADQEKVNENDDQADEEERVPQRNSSKTESLVVNMLGGGSISKPNSQPKRKGPLIKEVN